MTDPQQPTTDAASQPPLTNRQSQQEPSRTRASSLNAAAAAAGGGITRQGSKRWQSTVIMKVQPAVRMKQLHMIKLNSSSVSSLGVTSAAATTTTTSPLHATSQLAMHSLSTAAVTNSTTPLINSDATNSDGTVSSTAATSGSGGGGGGDRRGGRLKSNSVTSSLSRMSVGRSMFQGAVMKVQPVVRMKQLQMAKVNNNLTVPSTMTSTTAASALGATAPTTPTTPQSATTSSNHHQQQQQQQSKMMPIPPTPRSTLALMERNVKESDPEQATETLYNQTIDPFLRDKPKKKFGWASWLTLPAVMIVSWVILLICFGVDNATKTWHSVDPATGIKRDFPLSWNYDFESLIWTLFNPTPSGSRNLLHAVIPSGMFLFGVMISFLGIVLQYAAERTTTHVNNLIVKDRIVLGVLGFFILSNVFVFWLQLGIASPSVPMSSILISASSVDANVSNFSSSYSSLSSSSMSNNNSSSNSSEVVSGAEVEEGSLMSGLSTYPRFGMIVAVVIVSLQTVIILPFALHLSDFLDSDEVITKLMTRGLNAVVESINNPQAPVKQHQFLQRKTNNALKYLMDTAESAMGDNNKNLCSEAMDAMCSYAMNYLTLKQRANPIWFTIPSWMRLSPDFLILNEDGLHDIVTRREWFEWKVFRQYQAIFTQSLMSDRKEICNHVCINSRIIGETAGALNEVLVVDLCIKFFNTYLRTAINANDVRVIYNTLYQFRQMAERFVDKDRGASKELGLRAWKIAKFLLYYAHICMGKRLFFLAETVAHDLRELCQQAILSSIMKTAGGQQRAGIDPERAVFREIHEKLLGVLVSLWDISEATGAKRGVARALTILATFYLHNGQVGHCKKIRKLMCKESREFVISVREELLANTEKDMWEVSERGTNFAYLNPLYHPALHRFIEAFWVPEMEVDKCLRGVAGTSSIGVLAAGGGGGAGGSTAAPADFWLSKEGKQLKLDQELTNFKIEDSDEEDFGGQQVEEEEDDTIESDLDLMSSSVQPPPSYSQK